eukprot:m.305702 g.305702  ORF g.305702 m.305702 type:complete len:396 (+) comp55296_c0_seq2:873-2060(+)
MFRSVVRGLRVGGQAVRALGAAAAPAAAVAAPAPTSTATKATGAASAAVILYLLNQGFTPKYNDGTTLAASATKQASPSFANLSVDVLPDGRFQVAFDVEDGKARSVQLYEKSGKPAGEASVNPIVIPTPEPTAEQKQIAVLEDAVSAANKTINEINAALNESRTIAEAAAVKAAAAEQALNQAVSSVPPTPTFDNHKVVLKYFPIRGRGDALRLALADNGVAFEDQLLSANDWAAIKQSTHFKQVPVLYDNDFQVVQSNAILRHIGRVLQIDGNTTEEKARVDFINEGVEEVRCAYTKVIYQAWDTKDAFLANLPVTLANLEALYQGRNFAAGDKPTYADYSLLSVTDALVTLSSTALDNSPNLKAHYERMKSRPRLAEYWASRPAQINGNGNQ